MNEYTTEEMLEWYKSDNLKLERELTEQRNELKALQKELEKAYDNKVCEGFVCKLEMLREAEKKSQEAWDDIVRLRKEIGSFSGEAEKYYRQGAIDALERICTLVRQISREPSFINYAEKLQEVINSAAVNVMLWMGGDDGR